MQFESLKLFCDVARLRSFSQAAVANDITQSAASQIVLQLERRLGLQLVDRSTRPLHLTREGQLYYEGCKGLVEQYLELECAVRNLPAEIAPTVQVAAIYSVGLGDMSLYVQQFAERHPGVDVHIEYLHPDRVYERVYEGTADFGLVSFPRKSRELETVPWRDEEMVLTCAPTHRLAKLREVRPSHLQREPFVAFEKGLVIRREVDRFLRERGIGVDVVLEFDNIENIKKAVEIGAGIALLPMPTLGREIKDGTLHAVSLSNCRFVRSLGIIHRRNSKLSTSAKRFIDVLRHHNGRSARGHESSGAFASGIRPHAAGNGSVRTATSKSRGLKRTVGNG
jgi:DNA-binding transcriptional LysR family regulator